MCIFCDIVAGKIPSCKVYEDDNFLAFMDIAPIARGHTLVIPKVHCENIFDTPDDVAMGYYPIVSKVVKAVKQAFDAEGINIIQNNGAVAGQEVFHAHIHILPRYTGDSGGFHIPPRLKVEIDDIVSDAEKIKYEL